MNTGDDARKRKPVLNRIADIDDANAEDEQDHQPVPRALREEFDGIKPHGRRMYESPAERSEHARKASLARWTKAKPQLNAD